MFVNEQVHEKTEFGFQTNDTEWRDVELDLLFEIGMRRVIGAQDRECTVSDSVQQRIHLSLRSQSRFHFISRLNFLYLFGCSRCVMQTVFPSFLLSARGGCE